MGATWAPWLPRALTANPAPQWPLQPGQIWAHLGTILGLKLALCCATCCKKAFQNTLGKHVASKHQFFSETWSPRAPLGHQKHSKTAILSSKIEVFGFSTKVGLGRGLGALFGGILEPKLEPRGTKLGPCGQKDLRKTVTKTKQTNAFVPGGFGKVGSGWRRLGVGRGTAALRPLFKGKVIVGWLHRGHFSGS